MEIWKEIETISADFSYEVSNLGNVRSMNYNRTGKVQNLKIRLTPSGNRCVMLAGSKVCSVSQLVLTTFIGPKPSDKHAVFHKDNDCQNDNLDNLEWRDISIQNKMNGKNGNQFKVGHQLGFKKGNTIGINTRFKKQE